MSALKVPPALEPLPPVPAIPPAELTPILEALLGVLEQYRSADEQHRALIIELQARITALEAEVRRVKKLLPRPNIKPSALDKNPEDDDSPPPGAAANPAKRKRRVVKRRKKRLKIHRSVVLEPPNVPPGSRFRGYHDFTVQDLVITPFNTRYRPPCVSCGIPTRCSPISRRCSAASNQSSACVRSIITRPSG